MVINGKRREDLTNLKKNVRKQILDIFITDTASLLECAIM
jgi:hypothetical protein